MIFDVYCRGHFMPQIKAKSHRAALNHAQLKYRFMPVDVRLNLWATLRSWICG